ncbi:MAG: hypothetical protein WBQ65_23130 [Bryobacteraceae bacterium]
MKNWIPGFFTLTAGFAVAELSASIVPQSLVLADPPVAYYRLGEAAACAIAVDSSIRAYDGVYRGTSRWRVQKLNAPFTIEAWIQLIDDFQANGRILDKVEPGAGDSYGMDISASEAKLSDSTYMVGASGGLGHGFLFMDEVLETSGAYASSSSYARAARTGAASRDSFETRDVLGGMAIHHYARMPAHAESHYGAKTPFVMLTALGLGLILFGLIPRGCGNPLKFFGVDAGLSRARISHAGGVSLRKRSEAELNSFSACYATIAVQKKPPLRNA